MKSLGRLLRTEPKKTTFLSSLEIRYLKCPALMILPQFLKSLLCVESSRMALVMVNRAHTAVSQAKLKSA